MDIDEISLVLTFFRPFYLFIYLFPPSPILKYTVNANTVGLLRRYPGFSKLKYQMKAGQPVAFVEFQVRTSEVTFSFLKLFHESELLLHLETNKN